MKRSVVVTGIGIISPCGTGTAATWESLVAGRSGIAPIRSFDAAELRTRFAGEATDFDPVDFMTRKQARRMDRCQQFALAAASLAVEDADFTLGPDEGERAAVIVGTGVGGLSVAESEYDRVLERGPRALNPFFILKILPNMAAAQVAMRFGFKGPNWSSNSACATSAHAVGEATRLIQRGGADVVLAGGAEAPVCLMGLAAFGAIRALSTRNEEPERASRPFDADRDGFVLSEGSAILLLEEADRARERGAHVYGEVVGYGATADAYELTVPAPAHEGGQRAMRLALADAGLAPSDVDHLNAHATSTPIGDVAEAEAIAAVFGEHACRVAVSSTKSMTGHMTGAGGAAEAAFALLAVEHGVIPPTINLERKDEAIGLDCVANEARPADLDVVMSNSFGFGGTNVSLVMRRFGG